MVYRTLLGCRFANTTPTRGEGSKTKGYPRKLLPQPWDIVSEFNDEQAAAMTKWVASLDKGERPYFLEKTPWHFLLFEALQKLFSDRKVICVMTQRDPVNIIGSWRRRKWDKPWDKPAATKTDGRITLDPDSERILWHFELVKRWQTHHADNVENLHYACYEDWCAAPRRMLKQLVQAMEIEVSPARIKKAASSIKTRPRTYNIELPEAGPVRDICLDVRGLWSGTLT